LAIALYVTAKDWGFVEHLHDAAPRAVAGASGGKTPMSIIHHSPDVRAVMSLRIA
jgi:hypothetical protein